MEHADIHQSAIVAPDARIAPGVKIGPFCVIGENVSLGPGVELKSHVVIAGNTSIGEDTCVFPFSVLGEIPQDLKYRGEPSRLEIGARNRIREHVTLNRGTKGGGGVTRIGDDGLFMAGCHVAHDAQIGDRCIIVNSAAIAGHCILGDDVIVGGLSGIHQFVRIGNGAMIGAVTMVTADVLPYSVVHGARGKMEGINLVGLKRRGVSRSDISDIRAAFTALGGEEGAFQDRVQAMQDQDQDHSGPVEDILRFVLGKTDRHFLLPK